MKTRRKSEMENEWRYEEFLHWTLKLYGPFLSWLVCLPHFSPLINLLHSLSVLVLSLLSQDHTHPIIMPDMTENLTLYCCYFLLRFNNGIPYRQIFCTGYLHSYNRLNKRVLSDTRITTLVFPPLRYLLLWIIYPQFFK